MRKYPKLKYTNHKKSQPLFEEGTIYVQEKCDGSSFRFSHERNLDEQYHTVTREIVFGSRNVQFKNLKDENKQFASIIEYVRDTVDPDIIIEIENERNAELTFFGEAMKPHTLEYNFEEAPLFVGFDIYDESDDRWLPYEDVRAIYKRLGLETVPLIDLFNAHDWGEYEVEVPESKYGDVLAEGVTFKNYKTQTFSKFVRDGFKEKMDETFGKSKAKQQDGTEKLCYQKITNARIDKAIYKLRDEGPWDSIQMEIMAPKNDHYGLPQYVIADMVEEEGEEIFLGESWEVDLGKLRSMVSKRCARRLRRATNQEIVE